MTKPTKFGRTSFELNCEVRNKMTRESIITVERIVLVNIGTGGKPTPHGKTEVEYVKGRLAED